MNVCKICFQPVFVFQDLHYSCAPFIVSYSSSESVHINSSESILVSPLPKNNSLLAFFFFSSSVEGLKHLLSPENPFSKANGLYRSHQGLGQLDNKYRL